jgi:hypothetical protein
LYAQGLQWLVAISPVVCNQGFNKPADFREISCDGDKTEARKQFIFVHGN